MYTYLFSKSTWFTVIWFNFSKFLVQIACLLSENCRIWNTGEANDFGSP